MAEEKSKGKTKVPTARKRELQSIRRNAHNRSFRAKVKTAVKALEESLSASDKVACQQKLNVLYSLMDKGYKTGQFKKNKVARTKSRLAKKIKKIS